MRMCALILLLMGNVSCAWAGGVGNAVEVLLRSDQGGTLPLYPVATSFPNRKAFAEAVKGDHYGIVIRNLQNRRVGVVVAVDGRNIISGKQSWLRSDERMYILEPCGVGEFKGWRASLDSVNRFYFTDVPHSYAAAFHDESAMGVIAVAVYPEVQRRDEPMELFRAPSQSDQGARPSAEAQSEGAGTGFGRQEQSHVRLVAFEPEGSALEKVFIKYEWRTTLCRQGIIRCGQDRRPRNRLWDEGDFTPPPPGRF
jgi:hypothetical protein